jgi:hypothetical protein
MRQGNDRRSLGQTLERSADIRRRVAHTPASRITCSRYRDAGRASGKNRGSVHEDRGVDARAQRALNLVPTGVDIVIPRNDVHAKGRPECAQPIGKCGHVLGPVVNEIPGNRDDVRTEPRHGASDVSQERL